MVSPCRASGIDPPTTKSNSEPAPATTRISEKNSGGTLGIDPCLIIWIPFLFWWGKSWLTAGPCSLLPIGYSRTVPRVKYRARWSPGGARQIPQLETPAVPTGPSRAVIRTDANIPVRPGRPFGAASVPS